MTNAIFAVLDTRLRFYGHVLNFRVFTFKLPVLYLNLSGTSRCL